MAVFQFVLDPPLRNEAASSGIVTFELAGTPHAAMTIVASWDSHARLFAAFGLGFDYLFMPVYATAIALAALLVARGSSGWIATLGAWAGWGAYAAALFDALENIALFTTLLGKTASPWAQIAFWSASLKFGLIGPGILYGLIGWWMLVRRSRSDNVEKMEDM